jgi:hypothetical protein
MRSKTLIVLAGTAAAAAAAAFVVTSRHASTEAPKHESTLLYPALHDKVGDIAKIKVHRGTVEAVLAKTGDDKASWVLENRGNYPAEVDHVRKLVSALVDAGIVEPKTAKPDFYERIGVGDTDKPGALGTKVELFDSAGKSLATLIIGTASRDAGGDSEPGGGLPRYFVRRDGEAQSYLVKGDLSVQPDPMTWVSRTVMDLDGTKIKSVTVTRPPAEGQSEGERVMVSRATAAEPKFQLDAMPAGRQLKDESATTRLAQSLSNITMDDVLPSEGVDFSSPLATVEARTFDGVVVTGKTITKDGKKWFTFSAAYDEPPATGAPETPAAPPAEAPAATPAPANAAQPDAAKPEPTPEDKAKEDAAKAEAAKETAKADAAKAEAAVKDAAKTKVTQLNERFSGWMFVLPDYKYTAMLPKLEDLLKAPEPPPAPAPAPGTAPTAPAPSPMLPPG